MSIAAPIKRIALYARCSTSRDQSPEAQIRELRNYCAARGWEIAEEVVDHGYSGTTDKRPGLKRLMELSRARKVDVVITLKLDRLFRSLKHLILTLQEFEELGIEFVSTGDQIDLTTSTGRFTMHVIGAFSQLERDIIVSRTMVGLANARAKGKRLGRPPRAQYSQIQDLRAKGFSYRKIRKELGCSFGAITSALRAERNGGQKA